LRVLGSEWVECFKNSSYFSMYSKSLSLRERMQEC
jgi:hypothetical protein